MWAVIKIDKKKIFFLKKELQNKFGKGGLTYSPKIIIEKFKKNKLEKKEFDILGDYLFCYHDNFSKTSFLKQLNFIRGVKYFLNGFQLSQNEIKKFIEKCKDLENESGYISQNLYAEQIDSFYKFSTGPFTGKIFKILELQKNKINILMGKLKTSINKRDCLFKPI